MQFITKDRGGDWHFDGDKTYWCIDAKGNKVGKIYAEYIPDPVKLWKSKCEVAGYHLSTNEAKALKSSQVVHKLWEHKNANTNFQL